MKKHAFPLAAVALLASGSAFAAELIDDLLVNAEVTAACTDLVASDVDFGPAQAEDTTTDTTSTITVTCATGAAYTVSIDYGINPVGTQRQITGTGDALGEFMNYDVFQPDGTTPWGEGADGVSGNASGGPDALTAHFTLHRQSGSTAGLYQDTLFVTLSF